MALEEDLRPRGDITTNLIKSKNEMIKARIIAKQDGIVAGLEFCKAAFKLIGRETFGEFSEFDIVTRSIIV